MEIFIENERVKFTQGVQTFAIDYKGNQEELEWFANQLNAAFRNFMHEIQIETIKEYTEKSIQYLINGGKEKPDESSSNGLHKHIVNDSQFESYAAFCIECDRKGMKPLKYIDYLKIG